MTAFQNKRFSVTTSGLDPKHCRHESIDRHGRCRYCGDVGHEPTPDEPPAIEHVESGGRIFPLTPRG